MIIINLAQESENYERESMLHRRCLVTKLITTTINSLDVITILL